MTRRKIMLRKKMRITLYMLFSVPFLIFSSVQARPHGTPLQSCVGLEGIALVNGKILTMDRKNTIASGIVIRNGRFTQILTHRWSRLYADRCLKKINLHGKTVVPGLIDSHVHFIRHGNLPGHDTRQAETAFSIDELLDVIAARTSELPANEIVTIMGGIEASQFAENRLPTKAELDAITPNNPVYIHTGLFGPAVTNSAGMTLGIIANADTGLINAGPETLAAFKLIKNRQNAEDKIRGTKELMNYANRVGLTTVFDQAGFSRPDTIVHFDPTTDYQSLLSLWRQGRSTVRVRINLISFDNSENPGTVEAHVANNFFRFGDDKVKVIGLGEQIVADTFASYYFNKVQTVADHGWPLSQHSTSDNENVRHIEAMHTANDTRFNATGKGIQSLRWSLSHVFEIGKVGELASQVDLNTLAELGIGLTLQNQGYSFPTDSFPFGRSLGGVNAGPLYRTLYDHPANVPLGAGTDGLIGGPLTPWVSMYYMVSGRDNTGALVNPGETLTRLEALRLYTIGSAWFSFDEEQLGSIEVGKLADLAVLNKDFLTVSDPEIRQLHSVMTLVGGKIVFKRDSEASTHEWE